MRSISRLMLILFSGFIFFSCSNLKEPIPTNSEALISAHPSGWLNKNSSDFHGIFIRTTEWNLANCQQCHGLDYTGGIAEISCIPCHADTPEDCIVCHGGVENLTGAPPLDLDDNTDVRSLRVGAHTTHLNGEQYSDGVECQQCHLVPGSYADQGHVDSDLPAELTFGDLATLNGAVPNWDRSSATCSDSYCHGNWSLSKSESGNSFIYTTDEMVGNSAAPEWTDPIALNCLTCHNLPPTGHQPFALNECSGCHGSVINANGIFIDKSKHVNGKVNVFGQEFPMF